MPISHDFGITIICGEDFEKSFQVIDPTNNQPESLVGAGLSGGIAKYTSGRTYATFNGSITDPINGMVTIGMASTITSSIKPGRYIYDIFAIGIFPVKKIAGGMCIVQETATNLYVPRVSSNFPGGTGGGGNGATSGPGTAGTANTGGGGGGSGSNNTPGAAGGSGIVILRVPGTYSATFSGGLTSSLSTAQTGYKTYTVTAGTGTVTFS
jgi:hypothetical protein